jgi:hypothetical protein
VDVRDGCQWIAVEDEMLVWYRDVLNFYFIPSTLQEETERRGGGREI